MCCGSKRSAWRSTFPPAMASRATPTPVASGPNPSAPADFSPQRPGVSMTRLRYADQAPIRLRGPITGQAYSFSGAEPVQEVDVRDAAIFVRSARLRLSPS